jgi:hypothetical protein
MRVGPPADRRGHRLQGVRLGLDDVLERLAVRAALGVRPVRAVLAVRPVRAAVAVLVGAALVGGVSVGSGRSAETDDKREGAFVEALRREDPTSAEQYVALRSARAQAITELQRIQARYGAAGPELRPLFFRQLRDAERQYAKTSLALLEFLDARDRRALARYREEMDRINQLLERHARDRAELEKLLREE